MITINGCDLHVEMLGGDDPQKPLIIAHHGAPGLGSHAEPKASFGALSDSYRVLVFDARGSGRSGDVEPFTHAQWAADIDALRQWAGAERIIIAGGSYGGYMAMEYAIRYPQHVLAMVLRDTAPDNSYRAGSDIRARSSDRITISPEDEDLYLRQREGRVRNNAEFKKSWGMILPLYDHKLDMEKVRERIETTPYHYATHNFAFAVNQKTFDLKPQLKGLQVPTLITVGRHDWITPVEASEKLHELLPDSELRVFEHSGHSPQIEEAPLWQATVRDFLRRRLAPLSPSAQD